MTVQRRPIRKSAQGSVGRQAQLGRVGIHARTGAGKQAHGRAFNGDTWARRRVGLPADRP